MQSKYKYCLFSGVLTSCITQTSYCWLIKPTSPILLTTQSSVPTTRTQDTVEYGNGIYQHQTINLIAKPHFRDCTSEEARPLVNKEQGHHIML